MSGPTKRCDGKCIYKSEQNATRKLRQMRRRVIDHSRLEVYRCERHNGWHIGNRIPRAIYQLFRRTA